MKRARQTRIEWTLLAVNAAVCLVLSFLQYRWTGELSRAEPALLRTSLNEQVRRLVQTFDEDIRDSCAMLLPTAAEIREHGAAEAHRTRYEQWASSHDRSLMRVAVAIPEHGTLALYGFDTKGQMTPMEWPASWAVLRDGMSARIKGEGRPPGAPFDSTLLETPVFADTGVFGTEIEWMILDVNQEFVRTKLLPPLVSEYLNPGNDAIYEVSVSWTTPGGGILFSTRKDNAAVDEHADATATLFPTDLGFGGRGGRGRGRGGRGRGSDGGIGGRWTIAVRHRAGSLDAAVSRVRTRNLIASLVLVAMLGGTGWALVRYTARSRRLSEMQFRFAAGVSHDLRTPLTAIRGAAFNLAGGVVKQPDAVERYAKLILRNAEELTSMIENVLAFSASLHSEKEVPSERVSVGDLVQRATATMAQEIQQAGCRIEVTVAPGLPEVAGDPIALELLFRNLIGNAVRHGAGGKWIGVSAARSENGVEVRVSDHGPGIPEAELARIFEPFYRGEQTRAQRIQGTGLGLSLVKSTVERHRGTVEVHNAAGGGAQFIVRLPGAEETA